MKPGCLHDPARAKRFDNPEGYPGFKGIPSRNSMDSMLDGGGPVLVDTGMKKIDHLKPPGKLI